MSTPVTQACLDALRLFDTPTVVSAIATFGVRLDNEGFSTGNDIQCRYPHQPAMVGYAVTAKIRCSEPPIKGTSTIDRPQWWGHIQSIPGPRIVIVQDIDEEGPGRGAIIDTAHAAILTALGCVGYITNGAARDLSRIKTVCDAFQVYSGSVAPASAYAHFVNIGCTVEIGGLEIHPGSLLHGDQNGIAIVPRAIASSVANAATRIQAAESELIQACLGTNVSISTLQDALARRPLGHSLS